MEREEENWKRVLAWSPVPSYSQAVCPTKGKSGAACSREQIEEPLKICQGLGCSQSVKRIGKAQAPISRTALDGAVTGINRRCSVDS